MIYTIDTPYELGDIVYLATDDMQYPRMVTAVKLSVSGSVMVQLTQGTNSDWHLLAEVTPHKYHLKEILM